MNLIWRDVLLVTLFNIGAICFAVGLFLLIAPQRFLGLTGRLNRWISTAEAFESLDRSRPADRFLYRRHVWLGALLVLGSLYILYVFWIWYDRNRVLTALPIIESPVVSAWLYDSAVLILRGVGVIGMGTGVVIGLRPSLLKSVEAWGNRWFSTHRVATALDRQRDLPANWFPGRPRLFGALITLGSLYVILQCSRALWGVG